MTFPRHCKPGLIVAGARFTSIAMRVHRFEDVVRRRFRPQEIAEIEAEAHAELERYERGELPDDSVTDDE